MSQTRRRHAPNNGFSQDCSRWACRSGKLGLPGKQSRSSPKPRRAKALRAGGGPKGAREPSQDSSLTAWAGSAAGGAVELTWADSLYGSSTVSMPMTMPAAAGNHERERRRSRPFDERRAARGFARRSSTGSGRRPAPTANPSLPPSSLPSFSSFTPTHRCRRPQGRWR